MVYPTHGAGSLCSTGISSTSWSTIGYERRHDPLLAPMEIDAFARALLVRPADLPALLRPDAAAQPGRPGAARRGRPGGPAAVRRRARERLGRERARRRCALAARSCRRPRPGLAVDPGRLVVRDVARLGGRTRPADHPARRRRRATSTTCRARRCASGSTRSSGTSTAASTPGDVAGARSRPAPCSPSRRSPRGSRPVARRRRSSSMSGSCPSTRPATSRARPTSAPATCPRCSTASRATARSRRSVPAATARASRRRCCGAAGFEDVVSVPTGVPPGRPRASRGGGAGAASSGSNVFEVISDAFLHALGMVFSLGHVPVLLPARRPRAVLPRPRAALRNALLARRQPRCSTRGAPAAVVFVAPRLDRRELRHRPAASSGRVEARRPARARGSPLAIGVVLNVGAAGLVQVRELRGRPRSSARPRRARRCRRSPWTTILLPIGISFYTFHSLSYLIDIYRGDGAPPRRSRSTSRCTSRSSRSSSPGRSSASTRSATSSCGGPRPATTSRPASTASATAWARRC